MARKRILPIEDQEAFLAEVKGWRRECVQIMARAPIGEPFYKSLESVIEALQDVAEAVTGDRRALNDREQSIGGKG